MIADLIPTWTLLLHSSWTAKPDTVLPGYLAYEDAQKVGNEAILLRRMGQDPDIVYATNPPSVGPLIPLELVYCGFSVVPGPPQLPPMMTLQVGGVGGPFVHHYHHDAGELRRGGGN